MTKKMALFSPPAALPAMSLNDVLSRSSEQTKQKSRKSKAGKRIRPEKQPSLGCCSIAGDDISLALTSCSLIFFLGEMIRLAVEGKALKVCGEGTDEDH